MKEYTFSVMVALTYWSIDIEVPIMLTDEEVNKIKTIVAQADSLEVQNDEGAFEGELEDEDAFDPNSEKSLLSLLENNDEALFRKFWDDAIFPRVFVEELCYGEEHGYIEIHEDDNFRDWRKADFDELYELYGDCMELEHSCCCICRIPDWAKEIM